MITGLEGEAAAKGGAETELAGSLVATVKRAGFRKMFVQPDLIVSALFLVAMLFVYDFGNATPSAMTYLLAIAISLSAALLALVLASFALFISSGGRTFMQELIKDEIYDEALARFTWAPVIMATSVVLGMVDLALSLSLQSGLHSTDYSGMLTVAQIGFYATVFLTFYGVLMVATLTSSTLRTIAEKRKRL
ncbi:MAG: hypothetical protein ABR879_05940 [Methanomassiliicoccales archaeon]